MKGICRRDGRLLKVACDMTCMPCSVNNDCEKEDEDHDEEEAEDVSYGYSLI